MRLCIRYRRGFRSGEIRLLPLGIHFNHSLYTHNQSKEDHYHGVRKKSPFLDLSLSWLRIIPQLWSPPTVFSVRSDGETLVIIGYFALSKLASGIHWDLIRSYPLITMVEIIYEWTQAQFVILNPRLCS